MRSDFDLLDAWQGGDRRAGNELFQRHFESICRFFRSKMGEGVEDLIQRTFLACTEHRDRFRREASFRTFLFTVARNELYAHLRRRVSSPSKWDPLATSLHDAGPSLVSMVAARKEHQLLLNGLRHIPLDHQVILELFYWEDLSALALARVFAIPEGTVRSRVRKARSVLLDKMRELGEEGAQTESTLANLDDWVRSLKEQLPAEV